MVNETNNALVPAREAPSMNFQCPQLTTTNYNVWAIKMESILDVQGVWEAIARPAGANVDIKTMECVCAYLLQALPEEVVMQVANHRDPAEMWGALKVRYLRADRVKQARHQTLLHDLEMLRMRELETIDEVAGRIAEIATKIRSLGQEISDTILVKKLLNVVPESFLQIVATIEQFLDLRTLTFEDTIGRLKTYEERMRSRDPNKSVGNHLLFARGDGPERGRSESRNQNRGRSSMQQRTRGRGRGGDNSCGRNGRTQKEERPERGRDQ